MLSCHEREFMQRALPFGRRRRSEDVQLDGRARPREQLMDLVGRANWLIADKEELVVWLHASTVRRRAVKHLARDDRMGLVEGVLPLERATHREHLAAEPKVRATHMAVSKKLRDDPLRGVGGHREGEVLRARYDRRVDADDRARRVHERAAGIAWVERHVGLDDSLDEPLVLRAERAANSRHHARGDGRLKTKRVAYGNDKLPDEQLLRVAERGVGQPRSL
mmetsp:Transcript_50402/g.116344  ORF Transcript_50402/g.116344 Transcript_50402/m.116344 type:complete len:222 (-) Transcript_50402:481-1146(-)